MLVSIDAQILVWAVLRNREEAKGLGKVDKENVQRTGWLMDALEAGGSQIIVPAIAVAEYLTPVQTDKHRNILAKVSQRFFIAPFDVKATSVAASLFRHGAEMRRDQKGKEGNRRVLRADCNIIASSKAAGAKVFVTHDEECRKLAATVMEARDLPTMPNDLWGYTSTI